MQPLNAVRVLEIGELVGVPYATKLLADLGAEVIKIEPPGGDIARSVGPFPPGADGDPERSGLFLGLNTNKKSRVLDLDSVAGREGLADLIADADIVVHDLPPSRAAEVGLDGTTLLEQFPSLVICALTPFGQTGPHAEWQGDELTIVHGGGWGYLIPGDAPDNSLPPLTVYGNPATCQAALAAAFATLGSHFKARSTGVGEFIDMSSMAHVSAMLEASFIAWSYLSRVAMRSEGRLLNPWGIYQCADGLIFLVTVEQDQWERLVEMMGRPDWALLEIFATNEGRTENRDVLRIYLSEWTTQHSVEDLFHQGQAQRICFAPVFTMADLAEQPHLHERGFFTTATHPAAGELSYMSAPYRATPDPWQLTNTAPLLDADAGSAFPDRGDAPERPAELTIDESVRSRRPLEGVRVIDFSWVWAGPFCTMHLSYLGAEVIKIESASRPGLGRRLPVHPPEVEPSLNTSGYFNQWDQGKLSVDLDLSDPASIETVLKLVETADVVVDNYATGVMDRLGLSDDTLRQANPDVIIASVTGFGHTGPLAEYMGYGPTTAPLSGLTSMTGHTGGDPQEAGISLGDPAAGLTAAFAIMASLIGRDRGEPAARVDVSLWEATAANAVDLWMGQALGAAAPERMGSRRPHQSPHGVFRCFGDDSWIAISCRDDRAWQALASVIGTDAERFATAVQRKANEDELEELIGAFTAERDAWALTQDLQAVGVAAYISRRCDELENDPQLQARGFWERFDHPEVGTRTHTGVPWRTTNADNGVTRRAPLLGEHTQQVLKEHR